MLRADETLDDLSIDNLQLIQKKKGFRFTLDSVLVAHFATIKEKDEIVDLGTGTGVIPFILHTRAQRLRIIGVEIQAEIAKMAQRSVVLNDLEDTIQIVKGDLRGIHKLLGGGKFNLVTANPPYWALCQGRVSPMASRAVARHELTCTLEDVVASTSKLLNYQGRFALIYPVDNLFHLVVLLRAYHLEPRRIRFIHSFRERPARLFLLEARKNAPTELKVEPPLIIYEKPKQYSAEILAWYGKEVVVSEK